MPSTRSNLIILVALTSCPASTSLTAGHDRTLEFFFDGRRGQVEIGGRYAGAEFHGSKPLPSRISFYYPVANSIDLSTDYWKRGESMPMVIGIRVDGGKTQRVGSEGWPYVLSPHKAVFHLREGALDYSIAYDFCLNEPATVVRIRVRNASDRRISVEMYTHLKMSLRTSHTYARYDTARTEADRTGQAVVAHFEVPETQRASLFVLNAGYLPSHTYTDAGLLSVTDEGGSEWLTGLSESEHPRSGDRQSALAAFVYRKVLTPGDSLQVVQIVGSCRQEEVASKIRKLPVEWKREINDHDQYIESKGLTETRFQSGNSSLDASAAWARAILAANHHYINGAIVPMPCPAEYNFFFTHDVLLSDLGAIMFDAERVKRDFLFLSSLARDSIIPHAYYWKDSGFVTEFCTPDNWNHMWFVLLAGSYLRHSLDVPTGTQIYPLVSKSVSEILKQRKGDHLVHAFRPDWWDIGRKGGPRAYMTVLAIRAMREYTFISSFLGHGSPDLGLYEAIADSMQAALEAKLWDPGVQYLMNFNEGRKDVHIYMGSLLAVVFNILSPEKAERLVRTATVRLLDEDLGIRVVSPPDFHTDSMRAYFQLADNEAGDAYAYLNGGIWPHGNAWYALALQRIGRVEDAYRFLGSIMTVDGIARSPNGQPAMYEYRYSDPRSAERGRIDKPSFLWAAGFYLYTLYSLFGMRESEWNVALSGPLPANHDSVNFTLGFGFPKQVHVAGRGSSVRRISVSGEEISSTVLPLNIRDRKSVLVQLGPKEAPMLEAINAIVRRSTYDRVARTLRIEASSFEGHRTIVAVASGSSPREVLVDGERVLFLPEDAGIRFEYTAKGQAQDIQIRF